jgi:hypothetical protein
MDKTVFRYGQVETILARLHDADSDAQAGALRGRIKHLRRLGLPFGTSPGTGNKILYEKSQIYQFAFCLELEEFGINPDLIVKLLETYRDFVLSAYTSAEREFEKGNDYYFRFHTDFMSANWSKEKLKFPGIPTITAGPIKQIERDISALNRNRARRVAIFNMTPCVQEVHKAEKESK